MLLIVFTHVTYKEIDRIAKIVNDFLTTFSNYSVAYICIYEKKQLGIQHDRRYFNFVRKRNFIIIFLNIFLSFKASTYSTAGIYTSIAQQPQGWRNPGLTRGGDYWRYTTL